MKQRSSSTSESSVPPSPVLSPKTAESAEVYDLIDMESDDDYDYFDDDEFDDSDEEEYGNLGPALQSPLKPEVLHSKPTEPVSNQRIPVLPMKPSSVASPPKLPVKNSSPHSTKPKPTVSQKKPSISSKPSISKKPTLSPKPSLPPPVSRTSSCVALYDYRSSQSSDLSFVSGSVIEIPEPKSKKESRLPTLEVEESKDESVFLQKGNNQTWHNLVK